MDGPLERFLMENVLTTDVSATTTQFALNRELWLMNAKLDILKPRFYILVNVNQIFMLEILDEDQLSTEQLLFLKNYLEPAIKMEPNGLEVINELKIIRVKTNRLILSSQI